MLGFGRPKIRESALGLDEATQYSVLATVVACDSLIDKLKFSSVFEMAPLTDLSREYEKHVMTSLN